MKAFTIIELLITFLILSLLAGAVLAITNISILNWESNMVTLELVQEVRQAMEGITRESRQGDPSSIEVDGSESRLDFAIPSISHTISYYPNPLNNHQLIREHPAGTIKILANNLSDNGINFTITSINPMVLKITLQATKTIRNAPRSFFLVEEVKLRNE